MCPFLQNLRPSNNNNIVLGPAGLGFAAKPRKARVNAIALLAQARWLDDCVEQERDSDLVKATLRWAELRNVSSRLAMTNHYEVLADKASGSYR